MTERQYNDLKAEIDSKIATLSDECSSLTAEVREHFKNSEYEQMSEKTELFIAKNDEILDLLRKKENLRKEIRANGFDDEDCDQLGKCFFEGCEKDCPNYPTFCAECFDSHNCREEMDSYGYCTFCGAIVRGTSADYTEHGYDPYEDLWGGV